MIINMSQSLWVINIKIKLNIIWAQFEIAEVSFLKALLRAFSPVWPPLECPILTMTMSMEGTTITLLTPAPDM